jgi:cell division protein FtsB
MSARIPAMHDKNRVTRAGVRRRYRFFAVLFVLLIAAGGYLSFELGRYQAGYAVADVRRQRAEDTRTIANLERSVDDLRRQVALLETSREIDRETYAQVETNLASLQARIQAQDEELAFYQSIVSPQDGVAGLRIQNMEILPVDSEQQRYLLKLVLVQAIVHSRRVAGVVRLRLAGRNGGVPAALELADLAGDGAAAELPYDFRYFQGLEQLLMLPAGFEPERVEVEIRPGEPRGDPITHEFQWSAVGG